MKFCQLSIRITIRNSKYKYIKNGKWESCLSCVLYKKKEKKEEKSVHTHLDSKMWTEYLPWILTYLLVQHTRVFTEHKDRRTNGIKHATIIMDLHQTLVRTCFAVDLLRNIRAQIRARVNTVMHCASIRSNWFEIVKKRGKWRYRNEK